jgi:hypothetical protein
MQVKFTTRCRDLLDRSGLSSELAATAINAQRSTIVGNRSARLIACHWFSDDLLVLVDGTLRGDGPQGDEVVAEVVLALRSPLPAGPIDRGADAETVLAIAAESFGYPLACDADEPLSTLYSGVGSPATTVVHAGCIPFEYWLIGSFDADRLQAELVWAFRPDRYFTWRHSLEQSTR